MQQHKKPLDHVTRVGHVVAMIVHPSKAAFLHIFEHLRRNPDWVAKRLKNSPFLLTFPGMCCAKHVREQTKNCVFLPKTS